MFFFFVICIFFLVFSFFALQRSEEKKKHCAVETNASDFFNYFFLRVCIFSELFTYLCCFEMMANWTNPLDMRKL